MTHRLLRADLSGRVALVTGAIRGIGRAIADILAANNAHVVYTDINLDTAKEGIPKSSTCQVMEMDVTNETQIEAVVSRILDEHGHIDILDWLPRGAHGSTSPKPKCIHRKMGEIAPI